MITGKLVKFEPTNEGVTVMIKCNDDQMAEIVAQWKKQVTVGEPTGEAQSPDAQFNAWQTAQIDRHIVALQDMKARIEPYKPELFEGKK